MKVVGKKNPMLAVDFRVPASRLPQLEKIAAKHAITTKEAAIKCFERGLFEEEKEVLVIVPITSVTPIVKQKSIYDDL